MNKPTVKRKINMIRLTKSTEMNKNCDTLSNITLLFSETRAGVESLKQLQRSTSMVRSKSNYYRYRQSFVEGAAVENHFEKCMEKWFKYCFSYTVSSSSSSPCSPLTCPSPLLSSSSACSSSFGSSPLQQKNSMDVALGGTREDIPMATPTFRKATLTEDTKQHVDFVLEWLGLKITVDVKGKKRMSRQDKCASDELTYIEMRGENTPGWIHSPHTRYIAFHYNNGFLWALRAELESALELKYAAARVSNNKVQVQQNAESTLYCRKGKSRERLALVPLQYIASLPSTLFLSENGEFSCFA